MTLTVIHNGPEHRWPGGVKELRVACDHEGCATKYNDTEIKDGGGLKMMGWTTSVVDGKHKHFCQVHAADSSKETE